MSRLVIHIGTHKTATTRLQRAFRLNSSLLERYGVVFPRIGRDDGQHALVSAWNTLLLPAPEFDPRAAWASLVAQHAKSGRTVFVSSEEFSRMNSRRVDMAELASITSAFDEVEIVCTLRNQASFLQSVYQQISRTRPPSDWKDFFSKVVATRMVDGLTLDYNRFYSHLLTGFRRQKVRFLSYDLIARREDGIIAAFLDLLGIPVAAGALASVRDAEANISPQPLATFTANRLARPDAPPDGLVSFMEEAVQRHFGEGLRTCLLTREEVQELDRVFSPMNAALIQRISPYQPGFSIAPMLDQGADLFREDLSEAFWVDVCRNLEGLAG